MARPGNGVILGAMNTEDYVALRQARQSVAPAAPIKGPFASLQRLINTASFVSVDLTDTVFASLHQQRDREARGHINYLE
jgi:hypothetical protein